MKDAYSVKGQNVLITGGTQGLGKAMADAFCECGAKVAFVGRNAEKGKKVEEDIKSKYPNRDDLVAILNDETLRNPQTVMPPFGRNRLLSEKEINAVVDFLQTL